MVGSSFAGLVPSIDMVDSEPLVGIKAIDSGVVLRFQVDAFTHTWPAEHLFLNHKYTSDVSDNVLTLVHSPHELGCEEYLFFNQAVRQFEHGLHSKITDSIRTQNWIHS